MRTYTDELFATLEDIFFDETRDFEAVEADFFATASAGGMSEEEAIALWNELSF